jgi:hypothetical protein
MAAAAAARQKLAVTTPAAGHYLRSRNDPLTPQRPRHTEAEISPSQPIRHADNLETDNELA